MPVPHSNFFDYGELADNQKTRTSTFSKISENRDEISKSVYAMNANFGNY
jgi:hypothetical protein